jgi:hypothetical protein
MNEKELSLKIKDYQNKNSVDYKFKVIDDFSDIADEKHKVYIEVKPDHFAPAQLLHAIAVKGIKDAKYLGVANSKTVKLFLPPSFEKIQTFAMSFDPKLVFSPSQADKPELNEQANAILGEPDRIITLDFSGEKFFYITQDNIKSIKPMLDRYRIELDLLVRWLDGVGEAASLKVNNEGWLVNIDKPDMFTNERADKNREKDLPELLGIRRPKYIAIKPSDTSWFESLRVRHEDLAQVLHEVDRFLSRKKRREQGVFWTEEDIGDRLAGEILALTKPDYVVEPCVGGGSLIKDIVPRVKGAMNDISSNHVENCKKIFDGYDWKFTTLDVVNNKTATLIKNWEVPTDKTLLIYTNPPFGTTSTNRLASKKGEMNGNTSRKQPIVIPLGLEKYGKGNLYLPIVGRFIEIAKIHKKTYLAFFSPFGLFCGRGRHFKLFTELLKDFKFLKGYIFAGNNFHDINKTLPIALSVWEYKKNTHGRHLDLNFEFLEANGATKNIQFKKMPLLKDSWRYDRRDKGVLKGEVVVQHCESFDTPAPKVIHLNPAQGGSEMIPENVIKPLEIPNIPDELVYGLWSISVGLGAFGTSLSNPTHPVYMRDAYVHLPDFNKKETIEILAYSALHTLIKNYAKDRIGFFGTNKVFRFGGERLTKGVEYLFSLCKDSLTYTNYTIGETVELIKQSKVDTTQLRKGIMDEVSKRLNQIGYWDYVPIP